METTYITLTDSYQTIALAGAWSVIQVLNRSGADVYIGDTPTGQGFTWDKLDGMTPASLVDAKISMKRRGTDGNKVVVVAVAA